MNFSKRNQNIYSKRSIHESLPDAFKSLKPHKRFWIKNEVILNELMAAKAIDWHQVQSIGIKLNLVCEKLSIKRCSVQDRLTYLTSNGRISLAIIS